jgi:hypothetical protein
MEQPIDKTENVRRAALYLGPALLGSVFANSLYRVACEEGSVTLVAGMPQGALVNVPFSVGALYLARCVRDPIGRAAFVALAVAQATLAYSDLTSTTVNRLVVGIPVLAFAVLLTVMGVRSTPPRRAVIVATVAFGAMFAISWGARHYAADLVGRDSVFRSSPLCRLPSPGGSLTTIRPLQPTSGAGRTS